MGNMGVCGGFRGPLVDGRGGVNLDVSADRDSQARVIFFAGGQMCAAVGATGSKEQGSATYQSTLLAPQQGLGRSKSPRANTTSIGTAPEWRS